MTCNSSWEGRIRAPSKPIKEMCFEISAGDNRCPSCPGGQRQPGKSAPDSKAQVQVAYGRVPLAVDELRSCEVRLQQRKTPPEVVVMQGSQVAGEESQQDVQSTPPACNRPQGITVIVVWICTGLRQFMRQLRKRRKSRGCQSRRKILGSVSIRLRDMESTRRNSIPLWQCRFFGTTSSRCPYFIRRLA